MACAGTIKDFLNDLNDFYSEAEDTAPLDALISDYEAEIVVLDKEIKVFEMTVVQNVQGDWVISSKDLERHIDVTISDETKESDRPGYDVDVYGTYDEDGGTGGMEGDLCRTCPTLPEAWTYIKELQEKYVVTLKVPTELHLS